MDLRACLHELNGAPFNVASSMQITRALEERGVNLEAIPRTPKTGMPMLTAQTLPHAKIAERWSDFKEPGWIPEPRTA